MENVKELIAKNLTELRKSKRMTQQDLAEKLNYSDKAVSRWEHAETMPDIETLCKICDIYGVKFEYLLQKEQPKKRNPYLVQKDITGKIMITLIAVASVWLLATIGYIYMNILFAENRWTFFIWAIPLTMLTCQICNRFLFSGFRPLKIAFSTALLWSFLLSVYLELLEYNIWLIFMVGIPVQIIIALVSVLKYKPK